MEKKIIFALFVFILQIGCSSKSVNYDNLSGFWGTELNGESGDQKFVLYFAEGNNGLECQFHSYFNGVKFSPEIGADIEFDGENISFIANQAANVRYEGKVDTVNKIITGKLKYSNGSQMDFNLKKISMEKLSTEYPGLLNLTKDESLIESPKQLNDSWTVGTLAASRIDSALLQQMVDSISHGRFGKVHSVLIARNGKLVFEKYFEGFFINDLNSLQSCTKSIGSLLTGVAIDKGYIKGINEKVIDFFPVYKNDVDKDWYNVELKHLLTMSVGLDWNKSLHDRIYDVSNDVIETTFEQKFSHTPGQIFEYRNPQADLLSGIIINSTQLPVQDFAKEYLFNPLDINDFNWPDFKKTKYPLMSGSLALSSRSMLKVGQLVLDGGKWNDKQIVSKKWIDESTTVKIKTDQTFDYGYLWWIGESKSKPGLKGVFATGGSGQHIIIVPEKSLIVVTTADNTDKELDSLLKMVDDYIIKGTD
jgi:CubicO group peptidase (beta-lactamase class C family)